MAVFVGSIGLILWPFIFMKAKDLRTKRSKKKKERGRDDIQLEEYTFLVRKVRGSKKNNLVYFVNVRRCKLRAPFLSCINAQFCCAQPSRSSRK